MNLLNDLNKKVLELHVNVLKSTGYVMYQQV